MNQEKQKISFLVWFFPKISETFVLNQIIELKKRGHQVSIYSLKDPRKKLAREDKQLEKKVHGLVEKYDLLKDTEYGSPKKIFNSLKKRVDAGEIDIVYFQFPGLVGKILEYGHLDCPVVSSFHNIPQFDNKDDLSEKWRKKVEKVIEKSDLILPISKFAEKELIRLGCKKERMIIHPMGINTKIFKPGKKAYSGSDIFTFIMIGRFVEKKGFIYGIRAFAELNSKTDFLSELIIVGDGKREEKLKREVEKLKLKNKVLFTGKLTQQEVVKNMQKSQCLICPSITTEKGKREGLPITIMEALACGLPVIATRHAAIPEIIKEDRFLALEKDVLDLSFKMKKVAENYKEEEIFFADQKRKYIIENHNIKTLAVDLEKIFKDLIYEKQN